jgi:hypothetical protein
MLANILNLLTSNLSQSGPVHTHPGPKIGPAPERIQPRTSVQANPNKDREKAKSLVSHVGDTAKSITEGVTKTAIAHGSEAAKTGMKIGLQGLLHTTFLPINIFVNNLPGGPNAALMLLSPVTSWLSDKLESHAKSTGIELPMKPKQAIEKLLTGEYHDLSEEFTNFLTGFVEKAISPEIQKAFASGNPLHIAKATGTSLTGSLKGLMTDIQKTPGSPFLKPFKLLGAKIPFVNKLPQQFQPWAAGLGIFMFGGVIIRMAFKLVKWLILGAGGIAALNFGKKALMGGLGAGQMAGMGRSGGGGGLMNMVDMGTKALGMLSKK